MAQTMTPSKPITDGQIDKAVALYRAMLEKHRVILASDSAQGVLGSSEYVDELVAVLCRRVEAVSDLITRFVSVNRDRNRTMRSSLPAGTSMSRPMLCKRCRAVRVKKPKSSFSRSAAISTTTILRRSMRFAALCLRMGICSRQLTRIILNLPMTVRMPLIGRTRTKNGATPHSFAGLTSGMCSSTAAAAAGMSVGGLRGSASSPLASDPYPLVPFRFVRAGLFSYGHDNLDVVMERPYPCAKCAIYLPTETRQIVPWHDLSNPRNET